MKVICLREDLAEAVAVTATVASTRTALPILQTIKIEALDGRLQILGCDGEMWAQREVPAQVEETGEICVSAKIFMDLVSALPNGSVELELQDHTLHLKTINSKWNLMALSTEDFPNIPEVQSQSELCLSIGELKDAINSVSYAAGEDISQPVLSGVQFSYDGSCLTLVATDTYRLAIRHLEKEGMGSPLTAVVPTKALKILKSITLQDPEEVRLSFNNVRLHVNLGQAQLVTQLLAGSYPQWRNVLPKECSASWTFDRLEFLDHIKRTLILARDNANRIQFKGNSSEIEMSARSEEKGDAKESISAVCKNGDFEVAFNGRFLVEALSTLDSDGIRAEFIDPTRPAIIRSAEDKNDHLCIVMPMTTNV